MPDRRARVVAYNREIDTTWDVLISLVVERVESLSEVSGVQSTINIEENRRALNGSPIARLGINFFVMTLSLSFVARGTGLVITEGSSIGLYDSAPALREIGGGKFGDVPVPVIIVLSIFGVALLVLRYTGFGRMVYAVGGNTEAARLAGINVVAIRMAAYGICAALAAWARMMEAGRQASAALEAATGIEVTAAAAAAVLLGGTSFVGGYGGVFGTFLGVAFLGVLQNGLPLSGTSVY